MPTLNLGKFEIDVLAHSFLNYGLNAFDLKLPKSVDIDELISFKDEHIEDQDAFDYSYDGKKYHGRFGQMLFDKHGNIRLYLTTKETEHSKKDDSSFIIYSDNVSYYNLLKTVKNQAKNIEILKELLVRKNVLSLDEASQIESHIPFHGNNLYMFNELSDLPAYLHETHNEIEEISFEDDL